MMIAAIIAVTPTLPYTKDNGIRVEFVSGFPQGLAPKCGSPVAACVTWQGKKPLIMVLPNPCDPQWADDLYAGLACHELRHVNGWPGDHPL